MIPFQPAALTTAQNWITFIPGSCICGVVYKCSRGSVCLSVRWVTEEVSNCQQQASGLHSRDSHFCGFCGRREGEAVLVQRLIDPRACGHKQARCCSSHDSRHDVDKCGLCVKRVINSLNRLSFSKNDEQELCLWCLREGESSCFKSQDRGRNSLQIKQSISERTRTTYNWLIFTCNYQIVTSWVDRVSLYCEKCFNVLLMTRHRLLVDRNEKDFGGKTLTLFKIYIAFFSNNKWLHSPLVSLLPAFNYSGAQCSLSIAGDVEQSRSMTAFFTKECKEEGTLQRSYLVIMTFGFHNLEITIS